MAGFIEARQDDLVAHCLDRAERGAANGACVELGTWFHASFGELARALRERAGDAPPPGDRCCRAAVEHARLRHHEGDAIADLLVDCAMLCDAVCAMAAAEGLAFTAGEFRTMNQFVDTLAASAVREFARLTFDDALAYAARRAGLFAVELANASAVMRVAFTALTVARPGVDGETAELLDQGLRRVESLAATLLAGGMRA